MTLLALSVLGMVLMNDSAALAPQREIIKDCAYCPEMVVVPAGKFKMGSRLDQVLRESDEERHLVYIPKAFAVGKFEVMVAEYRAFVTESGYAEAGPCRIHNGEAWAEVADGGWNNPGFKQTGDHPVTCVKVADARAYADWLSAKTGAKYRLPSEAEWEYVARGGSDQTFYNGESIDEICAIGNGADQSAAAHSPDRATIPCDDGYTFTAPVGSFQPNGFGLYDTAGNVYEFTADCWHLTYDTENSSSAVRPGGECIRTALRGGAWRFGGNNMRTADRNWASNPNRYFFNGFRLVRELE